MFYFLVKILRNELHTTARAYKLFYDTLLLDLLIDFTTRIILPDPVDERDVFLSLLKLN
jgi:hypothetical protein